MSYPKLSNLAIGLLEKTKLGYVNWEETSLTDSYQTVFGEYTVVIGIDSDFETGSDDIYIKIMNQSGDVVEYFKDNDIEIFFDEEFKGYKIMKETFELARRQALGSEKSIDYILSELDQMMPF